MIVIKKEKIHNVPLLHVVKNEDSANKLPLIFFIHGVTSIKERNLQYAYMLAEKGYRVILPDTLYHGEREEGKNIYSSFWKVVITTIHEIEMLKSHFENLHLIDGDRIGLAGTSMGGIITLGAMAKYDWIKVGVSLMGNPAYVDFAKWQVDFMSNNGTLIPLSNEEINQQLKVLEEYDATLQIEQWKERPLLFWHGKQDEVVPYLPAFTFYKNLQKAYMEKNVPLSFILDEHGGHAVPNKGVIETVNWFTTHL
ncbi:MULTISPECIES: prolyl oligopeptidase family serine peptidase [Bacillus]|uniref:prolyl oligopeptidase family serine peptidase n=1 Tax=Bacillus TaxID=1386 RepID=UPI0003013A88|nr:MULTISPECIES: prolyl oligopeptidase family serine peptidase [Bacillus]